MSLRSEDQIDWLAARYVFGEMTESERYAFELRLAEDLSACEAVARATQMTLSLSAALAGLETTVHPQRRAIPESRGSAAAVGVSFAAIACILLVMILWSGNFASQMGDSLIGNTNREAAELVSRWRSDAKAIDDDADDPDDEADDDASDAVIPGWLMAGVQLEKYGSVKGSLEELQGH